jgi:hypothetical protein
MSSMYEACAEEDALEWLSTPHLVKLLASAEEVRRTADWSWLVDAFGQPYRDCWSVGQLATLARLLLFHGSGQLFESRHKVGDAPSLDRYRDVNQRKLDRLQGLIRATVDRTQHGAEGDGIVEWASSLVGRGLDGSQVVTNEIATGRTVLEIGHTSCARTMMHLIDRGSVARWAYFAEDLVILWLHPDTRRSILRIIDQPIT